MESNDLRALSELYLKTVYEAKAESPEEEEEKMKKDDDLLVHLIRRRMVRKQIRTMMEMVR